MKKGRHPRFPVAYGSSLHRTHDALRAVVGWWPRTLGGGWLYRLWLATRPRTIECSTCAARFHDVGGGGYDNATQGDGCDAVAAAGVIRCCYGSDLDTQVFECIGVLVCDCNPICDECIKSLVENGSYKQAPGCVECGWGVAGANTGDVICRLCQLCECGHPARLHGDASDRCYAGSKGGPQCNCSSYVSEAS